MKELLTTHAVAKSLNVAPDTVRFYERTGRLKAMRTTSGIRLFRAEDVEAFKAKRSATNDKQRAR
jgi:DNA-binding transcriptional MerR regulator